MISYDQATAWAIAHPWPTRRQIEQDLLLSQAICAIATEPFLNDELIFRGGTAFHKLHLPQPFRYSEDLDYVRSHAGGIAAVTGALTDLGVSLGYDVRTRISQHPKIYWRAISSEGVPLKIKIEINTHERSPAQPLKRITHQVESNWWNGEAEILTFQTAELVATKIRALYQRSKGRDLFDLWLAMTELQLDSNDVLAAFAPYRPSAITSSNAIMNLRRKQSDENFRSDIAPLTQEVPQGYSVDSAAELIIEQLLSRLDDSAKTGTGFSDDS